MYELCTHTVTCQTVTHTHNWLVLSLRASSADVELLRMAVSMYPSWSHVEPVCNGDLDCENMVMYMFVTWLRVLRMVSEGVWKFIVVTQNDTRQPIYMSGLIALRAVWYSYKLMCCEEV